MDLGGTGSACGGYHDGFVNLERRNLYIDDLAPGNLD